MTRRLGVLSVGRLGTEAFTLEDEELLAAVGTQVAFSVENALAFQEIAELKDRLAAEKVYLESEIRTDYDFAEIIGDAPVKVGVEAAVRQGWDAVIGTDGAFVGMSTFGASAPYKDLYQHFGITAEAVVEAAMSRLT